MSTPKLVEHFFRHEYGRLVATLSHRVGVQYIEDVEDAVQSALENGPEIFLVGEVRDDLLRMLFVCCDEAIPCPRRG